jgi:hypothetical protein
MKSRKNYFSKILVTALCLLTIVYSTCSYADGIRTGIDENGSTFIEASRQILNQENIYSIIGTLEDPLVHSLRLMFVGFQSPTSLTALLDVLSTKETLTELHLDGTQINLDNMGSFLNFLQKTKSLKVLGLCLNGTDKKYMLKILEALQRIQLEEIHLDGINENNATNLMAILSTITALHTLELNCDNISDELAEEIASFLSRTTTLTNFRLILAWNGRISYASIQRIIHAVENNPRLRETADLWLPYPIHLLSTAPQIQLLTQIGYFSLLT